VPANAADHDGSEPLPAGGSFATTSTLRFGDATRTVSACAITGIASSVGATLNTIERTAIMPQR
jgi:hypothetical protein